MIVRKSIVMGTALLLLGAGCSGPQQGFDLVRDYPSEMPFMEKILEIRRYENERDCRRALERAANEYQELIAGLDEEKVKSVAEPHCIAQDPAWDPAFAKQPAGIWYYGLGPGMFAPGIITARFIDGVPDSVKKQVIVDMALQMRGFYRKYGAPVDMWAYSPEGKIDLDDPGKP